MPGMVKKCFFIGKGICVRAIARDGVAFWAHIAPTSCRRPPLVKAPVKTVRNSVTEINVVK